VSTGAVTLFLGGDVMTGRGVDQALPHPGDPHLHESVLTSARDYLALAEARSGPIRTPVGFAEVWGDALVELARVAPDARIVNLETAVTASDDAWPRKGIHYRMHPGNVACLTAARLDCCVLANNHVLDWGYAGLRDTLHTLQAAGIRTAGAGADAVDAAAPAVIELERRGRIVVFAYGSETSGIPVAWAASTGRPGVNRLPDQSPATIRAIAERVRPVKSRPGTIVVVSLHWGDNWGYPVPRAQRAFARRLIDDAGADAVHGHSSHHPRAIEVYRERPILYGCGDLLNDYEGIGGYEEFRPELGLLYFPTFDARTGRLARLTMTPTQVHGLRLIRPAPEAAAWLADRLDREGRPFGTRVRPEADGTLAVAWSRN
jgi:poly-gamma-glutamate synthesis protein (capsule biosynthesis protein)